MHARQVAAHFVAFVWFYKRNPDTPAEAGQLATTHWPAFLPLVDEGLVRLLKKVATPQAAPSRRRRPSQSMSRASKPAVAAVRRG
jgi:hypothetical protein